MELQEQTVFIWAEALTGLCCGFLACDEVTYLGQEHVAAPGEVHCS